MVNSRLLSYLSLAACVCALIVIGLGAFTRLVDAGLGCPDWPGCYGQLIAPLHNNSPFLVYKAWAEMIHRYMAGTLSFFIFFIIFLIFKNYRTVKKIQFIFAGGLILLVIYQIMLGRWTVTLKLLPEIVTQHLFGGFLILTVLWLSYLSFQRPAISQAHNKNYKNLFFAIFSSIGLVIVFLQIFLGAWTSTHYASLSCMDFPFCINQTAFIPWDFKHAFSLSDSNSIGLNYQGGLLPEIARQTIQMTHRFGALLLILYWFIFTLIFIRKIKQNPAIMLPFYAIWGLLCVQICLGMVNIMCKLPVFSAVLHTLTAALLLLAFITLTFRLAVIPS